MKFSISNIGPIKQAELELGDLTVICGRNNSGKTYISYSVYGFLNAVHYNMKQLLSKKCIDKLIEKRTLRIDLDHIVEGVDKQLKISSRDYSANLHEEFSASEDDFVKANFRASVDRFGLDYVDNFEHSYTYRKAKFCEVVKKKGDSFVDVNIIPNADDDELPKDVLMRLISSDISRILFGKVCRKVFILTSERTGISLFYKELDMYRNALIEEIGRKNVKSRADFLGVIDSATSRYAKPIQDSIDSIRDFEQIMKKKSDLCSRDCNVVLQQILMGKFRTINKQLFFCVKPEKDQNEVNVPLHRVSSAVKSLFSLDMYIRHLAKAGDLLMIDEPELNLHPDNQRKLARLLAMLVNLGIRVFVTTHSDFVVKEFNNLIILSNDFKKKKTVMKKFGYLPSQLLRHDLVKIYVAENSTVYRVPVAKEHGFGLETFDSVICEMNKSTGEILYNMES